MQFYNKPNIIPKSTVLNATVNSTPLQLLDSYTYAIQVVVAGTPTGNFKLQGSADPAALAVAMGQVPTNSLPTNWTDLGVSATVSAAGSVILEPKQAFPGYTWVRVVYTDTSGGSSTATVTSANFNGKG